MTSPDYFIPSTADYDANYIDTPDAAVQPSLNNKIMVAVIVMLFCVILFIASLHIFGKWVWRSANGNSTTGRTRILNQNQANSKARNSGLSKAVIAQLPTFTYKAPATSEDLEASENAGPLECAVCLSEFQEDERGRLLPSCKHSFHIECIDMWFYSHSTCPLCRAVVMATTTTSPLIPIASSTTHEHQQGADQDPMDATSSPRESNSLNPTAVPACDDATNIIQIPTNILFCGDSIHSIALPVGSEKPLQFSSSSSSSSRSTRCVPQYITIEIPTRHHINLTSPGCISNLPSRRLRCASPQEPACSSLKSLKSPGLRESVKKMPSIQTSKEKRAFSSSSQEGNMESPKEWHCN